MKYIRCFVMVSLLQVVSFAWAYDIKVNGIFYNIISDNEVEVTYEDYNYNSYFGIVIIPEMIEYQEINYFVTSIGRYAFLRSNDLFSVDIPSTVTSIQVGAFRGCSALTAINIPNGVSLISDEAFRDCSSLVSVIIPNAVTSIGKGAFRGCSSLTQIDIGNEVVTIGAMAFLGCTELPSVFIPGSVRAIGYEAFYSCSSLSGFVVDSTNSFYESESGVLYTINKDTLVQYPTGKVGPYFMPNSVTVLEIGAFRNAKALTSVHLNDRVRVEGYTFLGCGLQSIYVNSSNDKYSTIDGILYSYNQDTLILYPSMKVGQCVVPNTVSVIGAWAFWGSNVKSVVFSNSLKNIGYEAFCYSRSLKEVNLPSTIKYIEYGAFTSCDSLKAINVNTGNRYYSSVDGVLFNYCQDTIIQYPAGKNEKTYVIPNTVTAIQNGYEREISQIYGSYAPSGVFSRSKLQSISVPNSVNYVGNYAFYNCPKLSLVILGNAVDSIGIYAFSQDSLLHSVVCLGVHPPKYDPTNALFWNANDYERQLTVPCGEKNTYLEKWGSFFAEIQIEEACEGHAIQKSSNHFEYGSVNTSLDFAMLGDIVDVLISSNMGYAPYAIEVCNAYDETILIPVSNNQFIMPNFDVIVKVSFSHTSVEEIEGDAVCVSPNPVMDKVQISCTDLKSVTLCTLEGRTVKLFNSLYTNEIIISVTDFAKGLYLLRIELQNGMIINRKIIIQ